MTTFNIRLKIVLLIAIAVPFVWSQEVCQTPNRRNGQCIPRAECRSFNEYFSPDRVLSKDEINFMKRSQCAIDPPKICCPDRPVPTEDPTQTLTTTATTTTTTTAGPAPVPLPDPNNVECGLDSLSFQIYGGEDTELDEFPWYALLEYLTKRGNREFMCGGSLISSRYVLTAAHCLSNQKLDEGYKLINIRLGEHNTATEIDCMDIDGIQKCADPPQNFGYEELILHPGFSKKDNNQHHDIALIRLDGIAKMSLYVMPVCLPTSEFVPTQTDLNVTIAGFGHTGAKKHSGIKQKALVPVWEWERCRDQYQSKTAINENQMCAGGAFNIDACHGDSGGPLMTQRRYWTLEAVVSYGNKCGLDDWPGVYTRVTSYLDWIKSSLRP